MGRVTEKKRMGPWGHGEEEEVDTEDIEKTGQAFFRMLTG